MTPYLRQHIQVILLTLITIGLLVSSLWAQTITLNPDEVINGIETNSSDQFRQRFDVALTGSANQSARGFTITVPSELNVIANSITTTTNSPNLASFYVGAPTTALQVLTFGFTGTAGNATVTVEFDIKTQTSFIGIPNGSRVDTAYSIDFSSGVGTRQSVKVSKLQNTRLNQFQFSGPDSTIGDTTTLGGRFYKLSFPSVLPDLGHTGISGLNNSAARADGRTDVLYTFYLSTDSALVTRPTTMAPVKIFTVGADRTPLVGQRQRPRQVDATFIREDYTTTFSITPGDSTNGVISLVETADNTVYYVYVLADPAPGRFPSSNLTTGGARLGFDNTRLGTLSGGAFLARSGPLLVNHPPEFVIVGWDYDNDGGDRFSQTGIVQVPSDIPGMAAVAANRKDNANVTVDTGSFVAKGAPLNTLNDGLTPDPDASLTMLFLVEDVDNTNGFDMRIFLSAQSGMGPSSFVGTGIDSLISSIELPGSDTLTINDRTSAFIALTRDPVTQLATSFVPAGNYFVYYGATDGDDEHRVLVQAQDDPFASNPAFTTVSVTHSPNLSHDSYILNDFTLPNDGDLDVITGIDISQMQANPGGVNLRSGPATRVVTISWGETGLSGDIDVDDNAQISLYYSTRSGFRDATKSEGYTSGNSDGSDLLAAISQGNNDTHTIVTGLDEDPDGLYDNQYSWDIWNYVSPVSEGSAVPATNTRYYLYGIITGNATSRLIAMTEFGTAARAVEFKHPPYIRGLQPAQDIQVSVEDPVVVAWEAVDVDNAGGHGNVLPGTGIRAPNGSSSSPNIRILLSSADFGEVTTWASITHDHRHLANGSAQLHRMWLGNSTDGSLSTEIELNENVDTSFVVVGNRLRNNLGNSSSSADLALPTNNGFGQTYFIYLAIDAGRTGPAGIGITGDQPTDFSGFSPVVRAPGRITFTGVVPSSPPTSARFVAPRKLFVIEDDTLRIPITLDDGDASGRSIELIDLFMTLDPNLFEAIDTNPTAAGIQPFTRGANPNINAANLQQIAHVVNGQLSLELIYYDQVTGLTFFDGVQPLVYANFKAKTLSGGPSAISFISIDSQDPRRSKMVDAFGSDIYAGLPPPMVVRILPRSNISGTVPLQGRSVSADTVTFFLREIGSFSEVLSDPFFIQNDILPDEPGIQVETTGINGEFNLDRAPSGRFILVAKLDRHLAGHDTLDIKPGLDISGFKPTLDGFGVDRGFLLAGDIAGVNDSTGTSLPDNFIGPQDLNAVNTALFSQTGDTNFNDRADLNRDGIINATDKDYTAVNVTNNTISSSGIRPVLPTFKRAVLDAGNEKAFVFMSGLPDSPIRVGDTFDIRIEIDGAIDVRTYEFHLHFDPTVLTPIDMVSNGSILENYQTNIAGSIREGDLGVVNSVVGRTDAGGSGKGSLGTIRLKAIQSSPQTTLRLSGVMLIDLSHVPVLPKLGDPLVVGIEGGIRVFHDANGEEILGLILPDEDPRVDFNDFIVFTQAFGREAADLEYDPRADFNGDARVDFADFLILTTYFGRVAVDAPSSVANPVGGTTRAPSSSGLSEGTSLRLEEVEGDENRIVLSVSMFGAREMRGWGLTMKHDAEAFEFLGARLPNTNLLEKNGGSAPLLLVKNEGDGAVLLASALAGDPVSGDGPVVEIVFGVKGDAGRGMFRVEEGIVFDDQRRSSGLLAAEKALYVTGPAHSTLMGSLSGLFESIQMP